MTTHTHCLNTVFQESFLRLEAFVTLVSVKGPAKLSKLCQNQKAVSSPRFRETTGNAGTINSWTFEGNDQWS